MFSFIAGVMTGAIGMIFVFGLASVGKPTEDDLLRANNRARQQRIEAETWRKKTIELHDELRSATRMAQYWRARCMNVHCEFTAACDGEGHYPTDNDEPTREEKLVSDIMDAVSVSSVANETKKDEAIPA